MDLENKEEMTVEEVAVVEESTEAPAEDAAEEKPARSRRGRGKKQKIETTEEKPQSEWVERVVQISRVTKVVKGGKKLSFRAIVIVGNKKGQVGVGCAKAAEVIKPASQGTGIIAGGAVRLVLELAGIENILAKSLGSKAPLNAANATLEALKALTPFSEVAKKRGLTMAELLN